MKIKSSLILAVVLVLVSGVLLAYLKPRFLVQAESGYSFLRNYTIMDYRDEQESVDLDDSF